ncbi:KTSC domain-containing protein [Salinibacillus xinjiangensis]|uniref:KTSC domain-containing protein n=1 Tax=Salinibacillus xinjiangensis TaxID=1229268 RepID=A0A6G1X727_9BACI|nr:KTSC domain-containing protein [Salinibacillus xinjiangensis]MRG86680.1 KTSC domain-containing protein [Salinibacillus xinjiangensis]
MKKTIFNQDLWNLTEFKEIGYDKESQKLFIFYLNGQIVEFHSISEQDIFQFITACDKEKLVEIFKAQFPFIQHQNDVSISI